MIHPTTISPVKRSKTPKWDAKSREVVKLPTERYENKTDYNKIAERMFKQELFYHSYPQTITLCKTRPGQTHRLTTNNQRFSVDTQAVSGLITITALQGSNAGIYTTVFEGSGPLPFYDLLLIKLTVSNLL